MALAAGLWANAGYREWDLKMHLPTASVHDSKRYGVFAKSLRVTPQEFALSGQSYRVQTAWLEHRAEPFRASLFHTRKEILPEMVLCVDLGLESAQADVSIKNAQHGHILLSAANGVRLSEVGLACPRTIVLGTRDGRSEVELRIEADPSQASSNGSL